MSDQTTATDPSATPATTPEPTADRPRVQATDLPPEALKQRLESAKEQARRELLAELGVENTSGVKEALEELKKRQDAEKSELERIQAEATTAKERAAIADRYEAVLKQRADAELAALTEGQRATITKLAGSSPDAVLNAIDNLRAGGLLTVPAPEKKPETAATAPSATAPGDQQVVPTNHKAVYENLREKNPFAASAYLRAHVADIYPPS